MANFITSNLHPVTASIERRVLLTLCGSLLLVAGNLLAGNSQWDGSIGPDGGPENNRKPPKPISIEGKSALINIRYTENGEFVEYLRVSFNDKSEKDIIIDTDLMGDSVEVFDFDGDGQQDVMVWEYFSLTPNEGAEFYFYNKKTHAFGTRGDFEIKNVSRYNTRMRMFWGGGVSSCDFRRSEFCLIHNKRLQTKYSLDFRNGEFDESFYSPSGRLMVLDKTVSYGPVVQHRDILPNAPAGLWCMITRLYKPDGRIARTYFKLFDRDFDVEVYPAEPYAKSFWGRYLVPHL